MSSFSDENGACFVGVDVGTGSARAGVFDSSGELLASDHEPIAMYRDGAHIVEQSSENIWAAVSKSVRGAVSKANVAAENIKGIGFDATCSLVLLDKDGRPLPVSPSGDANRNVIVWMDHRALDQTDRINATGHRVLDYVGGRISPEMETPKLLWLKENMRQSYDEAEHFFDLTDFLTWRASGALDRSVCTVTCKWTYLAHEKSWDASYFHDIGLSDLADDDFVRIGQSIVDPGTALANGLTQEAAEDLGLAPGTPVGAGLIDAHAGGVGTIGAAGDGSAETRLAYVFGTSACTMASSKQQRFVPGVWGPYYSAMVPGLWLSEGGQSAAGEAISHLLKLHPSYAEACQEAQKAGLSLPNWLLNIIQQNVSNAAETIHLAKEWVVVPEFLGNRAPFADPNARAIVSGWGMDTSTDSLVSLYVAGIAGLGYGLKQILDAQRENGVAPKTVVISGGAGESPIVKQLLSDAAQIEIAEPGCKEPVLLGSAMLGAMASGRFRSLTDTMKAMSRIDRVYSPEKGAIAELHAKRFKAFEAFQASALQLRKDLM